MAITILTLDPEDVPNHNETLRYDATSEKWRPGPAGTGGGSGGGGGAVSSVAGKAGDVVLVAADVSDASTTGKALLTASDAAAARSTVGAAAASHQHWAEDIFRGGGAPLPLDTIPTGITGSTVALGNHQHSSVSITDLTETVQDIVGAFLKAGTGVTVSYDDAGNQFTINSTAAGGTTDPEIVRDVIGSAMVAGAGIQLTVNDAGDTITVASTAVLPTRKVATGAGLTGGGDLSADRTLAVSFGSTSTTVAAGDHTHAPASETVVGPVELATATETTAGTDNTRAVHPAGLKVELDKKAAFAHSHWADDVFRGGGAPLAPDVLGDGAADATKYLAGDSTWKTMPAGGGGSPVARQVRTLVGRYYNGVDHVMTTNRTIPRSLACFPISFAETVTVDRIGMTITTAGSAANFVRLGIYESGADGLPAGVPILNAGTVDTTTTGVKELTVSQVLTAGVVYWLCYTGTSAAGSGYGDAATATQNSANMRLGRTNMSGTAVSATMVSRSGNSDGVLPDATGSTWTFASDYARPFVRIGAVA